MLIPPTAAPMLLLVLPALISGSVFGRHAYTNDRPIIGVLAQPLPESLAHLSNNQSYIAASYVKYLEQAGAQVVPISEKLSATELQKLFSSINGVLFPGGGAMLVNSNYSRAGQVLLQAAIDANAQKDYFPIWGTCLGFELLNVLLAKSDSLLTVCKVDNESLTLDFTTSIGKSSMFQAATSNLIADLSNRPMTSNFHHNCVTPDSFQKVPSLVNFFHVLSTSTGRNGAVFISTVEAFDLPIYGTQWHPEKNQFEWSHNLNIDHSPEAVSMAQYMANFFVGESRKNNHSFPTLKEEQDSLIYNYPVVYTGRSSSFEQVYLI